MLVCTFAACSSDQTVQRNFNYFISAVSKVQNIPKIPLCVALNRVRKIIRIIVRANVIFFQQIIKFRRK